MIKKKLSDKQYWLLRRLYEEQGRLITDSVEEWLKNLPALEASKLIDTWIIKNRKRENKWR